MVKIGGRDISIDQGINIIFGAGAVVDGATSMLAPKKVQVRCHPLACLALCLIY